MIVYVNCFEKGNQHRFSPKYIVHLPLISMNGTIYRSKSDVFAFNSNFLVLFFLHLSQKNINY